MDILSVLFPSLCLGCGKWGNAICEDCVRSMHPTVRDICPYCYAQSLWGRTHDRCRRSYGLDGALALFRYNEIAQKIVKRVKYAGAWSVLKEVYSNTPPHWWRVSEFLDHCKGEIVYHSIPLHPQRQKERGFNQSDHILKLFVQKEEHHAICVLKRVRNTPPQARQSNRAARAANMKHAFTCIENTSVSMKTVVLVDDLFTTGSTAKEAARALKMAGAKNVFLLTFAHGR